MILSTRQTMARHYMKPVTTLPARPRFSEPGNCFKTSRIQNPTLS